MTNKLVITIGIGAVILGVLLYNIVPGKGLTVGSVARGGEYQATTTNNFTAGGSLAESSTTAGTLGSVVITGANTGTINIYDATTSNTTLRSTTVSTSSLLVASFGASTAAGTYTFDKVLFNGLYVSVVAGVGTVPSTTITYRQ